MGKLNSKFKHSLVSFSLYINTAAGHRRGLLERRAAQYVTLRLMDFSASAKLCLRSLLGLSGWCKGHQSICMEPGQPGQPDKVAHYHLVSGSTFEIVDIAIHSTSPARSKRAASVIKNCACMRMIIATFEACRNCYDPGLHTFAARLCSIIH